MSHPSPPWQLRGSAVLSLHGLDAVQVQRVIPPGLEVVQLWPGKTIGGLVLANYTAGSSLQYHELIVVAGLVRWQSHSGFWISHIYVDHPDSVTGGRQIWGLPKELAEFHWSAERVQVYQEDNLLCAVLLNQPFWMWSQPLPPSNVISQVGAGFGQFKPQGNSRWGFVRADVTIPATSAFVSLNFGQPWLAIALDQLDLSIPAPAPLR